MLGPSQVLRSHGIEGTATNLSCALGTAGKLYPIGDHDASFRVCGLQKGKL